MFHSRVWLAGSGANEHADQYLRFRRGLDLDHAPRTSVLTIAAESDFILLVNGQVAGQGQYSDWPARRTFTTYDVAPLLHAGWNVIAVCVHHQGLGNSVHHPGKAGLILSIVGDHPGVLSDNTWRCSPMAAYAQGGCIRVTLQMGLTYVYDARAEDDWLSDVFDDSAWEAVVLRNDDAELVPRPVPTLTIGPVFPTSIIAVGDVLRIGRQGSIAQQMMSDALVTYPMEEVFADRRPECFFHAVTTRGFYSDRIRQPHSGGLTMLPPPAGVSGRYLILDLGQEEVGLLTLSLDAPAGTIIDVSYGEHLQSGRVIAAMGGRNFADRYVAKEGQNSFVHRFRRYGCRYIEVHITAFIRPLRLDYIGLTSARLDINEQGSFISSDLLIDEIHRIARRTLRLCMHEHFEDCPWREQGLYAYDSRNQALFGYNAFGNYPFAAASLDLLGRGVREDRLLSLCAPAEISLTIPIFSFAWIAAVAEYWIYSGDDSVSRAHALVMDGILTATMARPHGSSGLYLSPAGKGIWNFYEWNDGLTGFIPQEGEVVRDDTADSIYNLTLLEAIGWRAWMHEQNGDCAALRLREQYKKLSAAIATAFWNDRRSAVASRSSGGPDDHCSELATALALTLGVLDAERSERAASSIINGGLVPATLSSMRYLVDGLFRSGPQARTHLLDRVEKTWGSMILRGATSCWETIAGADDFDGAGSLCHGWSALPVFVDQAVRLGIRPLVPGFASFSVSPLPGRCRMIEGAVPTPSGPIRIVVERSGPGVVCHLTGPQALVPQLRPLPEMPILAASYNGQPIRLPDNSLSHAQ